MVQDDASVVSSPPPLMALPFNSHTQVSPVLLLRQITSDLPSPLKSPTAAMLHTEANVGSKPPPFSELPFKSQIHTSPVLVLRQMTSDLPSPLKSPAAGMLHIAWRLR